MSGAPRRIPASYVLPLRWSKDQELEELTGYLRWLHKTVEEVIVVDGSDPPLFERHRRAFGQGVQHLPPDPIGSAMGKVDGVKTGVRIAGCERIVIADDDVRYDRSGLERLVDLLCRFDLVRPQNYFEPLPWHARLDTGRTLLNRMFSGDLEEPAADFPGTLGVRRDIFRRIGGYDGNAMFENLELIRSVRAGDGAVVSPLDLYVARRPPSVRHYLSQRVRQTYDDFALPLRLVAELSIAPLIAAALARRSPRPVLGGMAMIAAVAEAGRRRAGGAAYFPASASALAPIWVLERGVCAWLAVRARLLEGGVAYGGGRVALAANPTRRIRARLRSDSAPTQAADRRAVHFATGTR